MLQSHNRDGILELVIHNPPVNALSAPVREALRRAIDEAQPDSAIKAIVIRGAGRLFSGGADITEFDAAPADQSLSRLICRIETSVKPVVAAIHGVALGGSLELALGCHYRVASSTAKLGLPEVTLGLLPGAGGTQRLPRLVGVDHALKLIVSGDPIGAARALEIGLIDKIVGEVGLQDEAISCARSIAQPRRTGELSITADPHVFDRFIADHDRKIAGLEAPRACIEAIKAATNLPLHEGLAKESELFAELVKGGQSKGLRHAFFADRAAARVEGLPRDLPSRSLERVGVIGAGTMGGGIAMNFLSAGIPVTIVETAQAPLDRGTDIIRKNYAASVARARVSAEQADEAMSLLSPTLNFDLLADCDLVIEAVYENMEVKKQIFARLDAVAKPGAVLASNTSYLSIDEIATATSRPEDVLGLHFFSPANIMKLLEVVRGKETAPGTLAAAMDLARQIGKVPVVSGVCYGFIGNRMLEPRLTGAIDMLVEGATPHQIDGISTRFGMPMGPLQMIDLAGVDIGWHRDSSRIETVRDALNAAGRWGQKTGKGFYDYDDKRRPTASSETQAIVETFRQSGGILPREISEEEITVRTLHVMVNEGAKILDEGIAQRASDIDVVWMHGYGWPRHTGGPMFWAQEYGLAKIVAQLEQFADRLGPEFSISPLLVSRAAEGARFDR